MARAVLLSRPGGDAAVGGVFMLQKARGSRRWDGAGEGEAGRDEGDKAVDEQCHCKQRHLAAFHSQAHRRATESAAYQ